MSNKDYKIKILREEIEKIGDDIDKQNTIISNAKLAISSLTREIHRINKKLFEIDRFWDMPDNPLQWKIANRKGSLRVASEITKHLKRFLLEFRTKCPRELDRQDLKMHIEKEVLSKLDKYSDFLTHDCIQLIEDHAGRYIRRLGRRVV